MVQESDQGYHGSNRSNFPPSSRRHRQPCARNRSPDGPAAKSVELGHWYSGGIRYSRYLFLPSLVLRAISRLDLILKLTRLFRVADWRVQAVQTNATTAYNDWINLLNSAPVTAMTTGVSLFLGELSILSTKETRRLTVSFSLLTVHLPRARSFPRRSDPCNTILPSRW